LTDPGYEIWETDQFQADLKNLAQSGQARLIKKLRTVVYPQLRTHPHYGPNIKKLKEYAPDTWRFRIGAWRFFYEIDEENRRVWMIAAAHRGVAY
jgi:mRNA interferase RelE/StbE